MARAFPGVPMLTVARDEVVRLVELAADDKASHTAHRLSLAEAILTLAGTAPPAGALAASGTAAARVRRLISGHRPLANWAGALGMTAALTLIVAPLIALATPAVTAGPDCCTVERQRTAAAGHCSAATRDC